MKIAQYFFTQERPIMVQLPETGYLRLPQIIGNTKKNIPALIPVSRSAWWAGIKAGRYPKGIHLGPKLQHGLWNQSVPSFNRLESKGGGHEEQTILDPRIA
jgi:prophage regulatory protein